MVGLLQAVRSPVALDHRGGLSQGPVDLGRGRVILQDTGAARGPAAESRRQHSARESPGAPACVHRRARRGYKIAGQVPTTLVVLHCGPELLSERLGLALGEAPDALRALAGTGLAAGVR